MEVPFADLRRSSGPLSEELLAAAERVLRSGRLILGPEVEAFEREFAAAQGARHAVGVASGTDALEVALRALGVGPGDEVVTQANTCVPTVAAIERAGAAPVLCDVDEATAGMDPASLAGVVTARTRCVVPVHLYGHPADIEGVRAASGGVPILEDCAQAHLGSEAGHPVGTLGAAGAFSFYPTKNLGAIGDAGAVVTDDGELAARMRRVRVYGERGRYDLAERGVNSRLDELQAAMLRVKLGRLEEWAARRRDIAGSYDEALAGTSVRPVRPRPGSESARHLYVVVAPDRAAFREALGQRGVGSQVHYPCALHEHGPYWHLGDGVSLERAEHLARHVVSLPLFPELTDAEVAHVGAAAREAAQLQ